MNQPVVVSSFENVEMERLRLTQESTNLGREEAAYREQLLLLQQKLARASFSVLPADQIPAGFLNDFRSFLSANASDVGRSAEYYKLLTETLSDLIPSNPYSKGAAPVQPNVTRAEEKLQRLFAFPEDEGISRNIMAQVAAVRGGTKQTDEQRESLRVEYNKLLKRQRDLARNIAIASEPPALRPSELPVGAAAVPGYLAELKVVEERIAEIKTEAQGLAPTLRKTSIELQFQQFIIELAFQQRYVHSLIAAGFYRLYSTNMAVSPNAYPQQQSGSGEAPSTHGSSGAAAQLVPYVSNVPALETFLMNRISDTTKDRAAIDNMLKARQLSAAENLVRELVLTAKYQPELHTIPYEQRQRLLGFSDRVRKLSDSLGTKNYTEITKVAEEIESLSTDPGMADIKSFAQEHPKKALQWVRQAEVALKLGDARSMNSLKEAAHSRAPLDPQVEKAIRDLETEILEGGQLKDDLKRLVEADSYREIYRRRDDFARFASSEASSDPELGEKFRSMIDKETSIQETLKKCDEFESRSSYADICIALSEAPPELAGDERIKERRESNERRCQAFATAYRTACEQDKAGNAPVALAWFLTALSEAPGSTAKLKPRIEELGRLLANE